MAVIDYGELPDRPVELGVQQTNRATRTFWAKTNSTADDGTYLSTCGIFPAFRSSHPNNPSLLAKKFRASHRDNSAYLWTIAVEYDDVSDAGSLPKLSQEIQPIPWLRQRRIEGNSVHRSVPLKRAVLVATATISTFGDGESYTIATGADAESMVCNTCFDAIEGAEYDQDDFQWTVTYNLQSIPFWVVDYQNSINAASVNILGLPIPRRKLKLSGFRHSSLLEERPTPYVVYNYYQIQFTLNYRKEGWWKAYPNLGLHQLVSGKRVRCLDDKGQYVSKPVQLDSAGAQVTSPTLAATLFRWYSKYPEKDFGVFNLS